MESVSLNLFFFLPLLIELAFGFVIRVFSRRAIWSILACVIIPPALAMVAPGPKALFAETGEPHYWAIFGFIFYTLFGLAACGMGVALGYLVRQKKLSAQ